VSKAPERERINWLKLHLQSCLDREAEVVTVKGEVIYGRLAAFSVDTRPPFLILETEGSKVFVNMFRVERLRVAKGAESGPKPGEIPTHALNPGRLESRVST